MTPILITGANGFVGSNLYKHLSGDYHLIGLDITGPGMYPPGDLYGWDALESLPPADVIIHLAGKAHDTSNTGKEEEYFDINLGLTKKIFDYFLQSTAEKFIFFSSVKAVADAVPGGVLTEDDIPAPLTPYGKSKLAAERYMEEAWGHEGMEAGKRVYILRPAMIHGPGNKGNLNLLYKIVQKGIHWPLGAFINRRSFASMDNVAFVIRQLIEKPVLPGIYQLADDETVSTNELIQLMAHSLGRRPKILRIPPGIIRAVANTGDILHLPLNNERLKKLTESYVVSNAKLLAALGIEKMPVDASEGLEQTLRSFRERKKAVILRCAAP